MGSGISYTKLFELLPARGKINWHWSRSMFKVTTWGQLKGLQGSCMPNINALSLILQKIWVRLIFCDRWRDGQTDRWMDECVLMSPALTEARGHNSVVFWPNVMLIGSFACSRIDWCLAKVIVRYELSDAFCRWSLFLLFNILDYKILTQFVIYYKSRCPHNSV